MAWDIISRIPDRDDLDSYEKLVLIIMGDRADDEGLLWYANETIARKCSMTKRGVQKVLDRLIERLIIKKMHRHDRSNFYILNLEMLPHVERPARPTKERGPIEYLEEEPDLFAGRGERRSSRRGERGSARGEHGSVRGEPGSPDSLSDSLMTPEETADDRLCRLVAESWGALREQFSNLAAFPPLTDERRRGILRRTAERAGARASEAERHALWELVFEQIAGSKLLVGEATDWQVDFDWVLKKAKFGKIVEKQYGNGRDRRGTAGRGDRSAVEAGLAALDLVRGHRERNGSHPAG